MGKSTRTHTGRISMNKKKLTKEDINVWERRGIMYVPHYLKPKVWVAPGYPQCQDVEFTATMLEKLGAKKTTHKMWRSRYDN
jgi:hypothetical protein